MVFNGCNHMINGTLYASNLCPKCRGKNYYKDIAFDNNGHAILCDKEIKLQQEVLKIVDDPKFGNKFHQLWKISKKKSKTWHTTTSALMFHLCSLRRFSKLSVSWQSLRN